MFFDVLKQTIIEKNLSDKSIKEILNKFENTIEPASEKIANVLYKSLRKSMRSMLRDRRDYLNDFQRRHYKLWKKGIDLLESYLVSAFELGESFNSYYRDEATRKKDFLFDALTRLHARSIHIGFEVLCLLKFGFPDGAHARWRTAHEIAVVANFLSNHGCDIAKKYLDHEVIESYRAMCEFQEYADHLGQEKFSKEEVIKLKRIRDKLCKKYGEAYGTQYGWSAEVLRKSKPTFFDIEKASGLDHLRPYYKMASYNVHANPKGIKFRLGLSDGVDILLAGPSNYGLTDPAQGIALSILQATAPLLNLRATIDSVIMEKILLRFVDDISKSFWNIEKNMKGQETAQPFNPADRGIASSADLKHRPSS